MIIPKIPLMIIPILNRGDLLLNSIKSLYCNILDKILIIDNSYYDLEVKENIDEVEKLLKSNNVKFELIRNNYNIGVSKSWNLGMNSEKNPYYVISSNDIIYEKNLLIKYQMFNIQNYTRNVLIADNDCFPIFTITQELINNIGYFDESFYPCYWEDEDYLARLNNEKTNLIRMKFVNQVDYSATNKNNPILMKNKVKITNISKDLFVKKWGTVDLTEKRFNKPYNNSKFTNKDINLDLDLYKDTIISDIYEKDVTNIIFRICSKNEYDLVKNKILQINNILNKKINFLLYCEESLKDDLDSLENVYFFYFKEKDENDFLRKSMDYCLNGNILFLDDLSIDSESLVFKIKNINDSDFVFIKESNNLYNVLFNKKYIGYKKEVTGDISWD